MITIVILCLSILLIIIYYIIKKNSDSVKRILQINEKYNFIKDIKKRIKITESYNSRKKLRKVNIHSRIIYALYNNEKGCMDNRIKVIDNRKKYEEYLNDCKEIINDLKQIKNNNVFQIIKNKIEILVCKDTMLRPVLNFILKYYAYYESPKGRNFYSISKKYNFNELEEIYNFYQQEVEKEKLRREFIFIERSKVSDSLRYDVLKRDNFKCVICGATTKDGVKLHIDHIKPVSKGGKTILSNLQTLCERCNMGKSDKI